MRSDVRIFEESKRHLTFRLPWHEPQLSWHDLRTAQSIESPPMRRNWVTWSRQTQSWCYHPTNLEEVVSILSFDTVCVDVFSPRARTRSYPNSKRLIDGRHLLNTFLAESIELMRFPHFSLPARSTKLILLRMIFVSAPIPVSGLTLDHDLKDCVRSTRVSIHICRDHGTISCTCVQFFSSIERAR